VTALLRCVVAEDEAEARASLAAWLAGAPGVALVGQAASGPEAVAVVEAERPDLLLLDVRLPELDGLEVLRRLRHRPDVIFTTAHEAYAVTAFELGAVDYLLKPFGRQRLLGALERAQARAAGRAGEPAAVERALATADRPLRRLFARSGTRVVPVPLGEVTRIEAAGEYAELHTAGGSHLVRLTLRELAACLDPEVFEQVHRAHIVNLDAVLHLRPADDRRLLLVMKDGATVLASRSASERLRARFR
jgi:two-component system LytT family response regulator